jgi:hypothetical protein
MFTGMESDIDERVRAAHVDHLCAGGAGLPERWPNGPGMDLGDARRSWAPHEDHQARAAGETCRRCRRPLGLADDARRRASGGWVHENCPGGFDVLGAGVAS